MRGSCLKWPYAKPISLSRQRSVPAAGPHCCTSLNCGDGRGVTQRREDAKRSGRRGLRLGRTAGYAEQIQGDTEKDDLLQLVCGLAVISVEERAVSSSYPKCRLPFKLLRGGTFISRRNAAHFRLALLRSSKREASLPCSFCIFSFWVSLCLALCESPATAAITVAMITTMTAGASAWGNSIPRTSIDAPIPMPIRTRTSLSSALLCRSFSCCSFTDCASVSR